MQRVLPGNECCLLFTMYVLLTNENWLRVFSCSCCHSLLVVLMTRDCRLLLYNVQTPSSRFALWTLKCLRPSVFKCLCTMSSQLPSQLSSTETREKEWMNGKSVGCGNQLFVRFFPISNILFLAKNSWVFYLSIFYHYRLEGIFRGLSASRRMDLFRPYERTQF